MRPRNRMGILPLLVILLVVLAAAPSATKESAEAPAWVAPDSAEAIQNPLAGQVATVEAGRKLFKNMCEVCHGSEGKGDGLAGTYLTPSPADLTNDRIQTQSDGAFFWKLAEGRPPMASYRDVLTDDERWQLINYIRVLGGKKPSQAKK